MNEIYLYGEIYPGKIDERYVQSVLNSSKSNELTVYINSPGGHVFTGLAIYNLLLTRRPSFKIIGQASSIASVIACSGHVKIARSAMMLIHNPWSFAIGDDRYHNRISNELSKIKNIIIDAYSHKTGQSREDIIKIMDSGQLLSADECVEYGFADEIIQPNDAEIKSLYKHSALANSNNNKGLLDRIFNNNEQKYEIIMSKNNDNNTVNKLENENRMLKNELENYEKMMVEVACEKFITDYQDRIYPNEAQLLKENLINFKLSGNENKFDEWREMISSREPYCGLNINLDKTVERAYILDFNEDINNSQLYEITQKYAAEKGISYSEALSKLAAEKY